MNADARITLNGGATIGGLVTVLGFVTGEAVVVTTGCGLAGAALAVALLFDEAAPE